MTKLARGDDFVQASWRWKAVGPLRCRSEGERWFVLDHVASYGCRLPTLSTATRQLDQPRVRLLAHGEASCGIEQHQVVLFLPKGQILMATFTPPAGCRVFHRRRLRIMHDRRGIVPIPQRSAFMPDPTWKGVSGLCFLSCGRGGAWRDQDDHLLRQRARNTHIFHHFNERVCERACAG